MRYKPFFLGIALTSITWAVVLYVYLDSPRINWPLDPGIHHWKLRPRRTGLKGLPTFIGRDVQVHVFLGGENFTSRIGSHRFLPNRIDAKLNEIQGISDLAQLGVIRSPEDQRVKVSGYHHHAFNVLISNRMGFHRKVPDTRNAMCKEQRFPLGLPQASVVICFFNEAWSALLRTVHSVLDRTPAHLLKEVILVDDNSTIEDLGERLQSYIKNHLPQSVILVRTHDREGLIRARTYGARHASSEVLVFLDSHCEVNEGWIEPLLERIHANRTTVTCPIIDIINADTFEYTASPIVRGGFNWGLHFKWDPLPPGLKHTGPNAIKPIPSPTMAGGLFAIDRKFFHKLGEYDDGMDIWGGENLEMSFRIWMCGGQLEIIPCSRVGHVFRRRRPYGSPTGEDTLTKNSLRVAHVWMDEYKVLLT